MERHLNVINNRKQRKLLTALRIGAHKLKTKRGRYSGQGKEKDCVLSAIEDEIRVCGGGV